MVWIFYKTSKLEILVALNDINKIKNVICNTFIKFYLTLKTPGLVNLFNTIGFFKDSFKRKLYLYVSDHIKILCNARVFILNL